MGARRLSWVLLAVLAQPALPFGALPTRPLAGALHASHPGCRQRVGTMVHTGVWSVMPHASLRRARLGLPRCNPSTAMAAPATVVTDPAPNNPLLRRLWVLRRTAFIWSNVVGHAIKVIRLRGRMLRGEELVAARRKNAADLRDTLIKLGPTFIKIGQLLSTRVDVLAPEVIQELSQLQNEVPSFSAKRALAIVEEELGQPVGELFESFDEEPLAAASLAQVHHAVLAGGQEVVVKVQRENLLDLFKVDLWNIKLVARLADRFDSQTEAVAANWKNIADTSGKVLFREVDFHVEREACEAFGRNFADFDAIKIPSTFPEFSTSKVLTMEYVPGVKISDAQSMAREGFDPVHLSEQLCTSYLEQVCRHGFFHCDPHPGNLAVDHGYPGGRLIYYDFGMMEVMEPEIKKGFVDLIFSIYENLPREAVVALEQMGVLRSGADISSIERIARSMLNQFQSTLASADNKWENQMTPEEKKASRRARRAKLGQDLFATQADKPFLFPPKWTFVFRAFSTIDGIGKGLDPAQFDLTRISQPYLRELANLRDGSTTTTAVKELGRRLGLRPKDIAQAVQQPRVINGLAESMRRIEEGEVKLRVRTLEVERMLERMEERQQIMGNGLGAMLLYQLSTRAVGGLAWQRLPLLAGAAKMSWECWRAYSRMNKMKIQAKRFSNDGDEQFDQVDVYSSMEGSPMKTAADGQLKDANGEVVEDHQLPQASRWPALEEAKADAGSS